MKKKITGILALLLVTIMSLTACTATPAVGTQSGSTAAEAASPVDQGGQAAPAGIVSSKDSITVAALYADPGSADPSISTANACGILYMIGDTLIRWDMTEDGKAFTYNYSLVESGELDEDMMGITLHIKQGVLFNNGEEMKAEDVKASIDYYVNTALGASNISWLEPAGTTVVDDYTVHVTCKQPCTDWMSGLYWVKVFSADCLNSGSEQRFTTECVSTGAYKIVEWNTGDSVKMVRNEYRAQPAYIEKLTLRFIEDATVAEMELESGGVDFVYRANKTVGDAAQAAGCQVAVSLGDLNAYFGFNLAGELTGKLPVRQAICYAIDRDLLYAGAFDGAGSIPYSFWSTAVEGAINMEDQWIYSYNPEKAKELLAQAGYPDGITIRLIIDTNATRVATAEQLVGMLAESGITVEIQQYDNATYTALISDTTDFDCFLRGVGSGGNIGTMMTNQIPTYLHIVEGVDGYDDYMETAAKIVATADATEKADLYKYANETWWTEWLYGYPLQTSGIYNLLAADLDGLYAVGNIVYWDLLYWK